MTGRFHIALGISAAAHAALILLSPMPWSAADAGLAGQEHEITVLGVIEAAAAPEHAVEPEEAVASAGATTATPGKIDQAHPPEPEKVELLQADTSPVEADTLEPEPEGEPPLAEPDMPPQRPQSDLPMESLEFEPPDLEPLRRELEIAARRLYDELDRFTEAFRETTRSDQTGQTADASDAHDRKDPLSAVESAPTSTRHAEEASPGQTQDPGTAQVQAGRIADARTSYLAGIRRRIEANKYYPRAARQRFRQGTVRVSFVLLRDGMVEGIRVSASSGDAQLDRGAVQTIERAAPFEPMPQELPESRLTVTVPIEYSVR